MAQTVFAPWDDPQAKPLIQFRNVTKRFGDFTAIENLTQDIYEREFFSLLGPSGCGKTTLMRMLAGFENVTEGQILIAGQDMANVPPNKRAVNMMFQSYALFPHLSVWENIAFGLKREGKPKAEIDARVDEMLRLTRPGGYIMIGFGNTQHPINLAKWKGGKQYRLEVTPEYLATWMGEAATLCFSRDSFVEDARVRHSCGDTPLFYIRAYQRTDKPLPPASTPRQETHKKQGGLFGLFTPKK